MVLFTWELSCDRIFMCFGSGEDWVSRYGDGMGWPGVCVLDWRLANIALYTDCDLIPMDAS